VEREGGPKRKVSSTGGGSHWKHLTDRTRKTGDKSYLLLDREKLEWGGRSQKRKDIQSSFSREGKNQSEAEEIRDSADKERKSGEESFGEREEKEEFRRTATKGRVGKGTSATEMKGLEKLLSQKLQLSEVSVVKTDPKLHNVGRKFFETAKRGKGGERRNEGF